MGLLKRFVSRVRRKGIIDTLEAAFNISMGVADYYFNPLARKHAHLPPSNFQSIRGDIVRLGIDVIPYRINLEDFHKWLEKTPFPKEYKDSYRDSYGPHMFIEKALEHYLSTVFLGLNETDTFIDIAAANSNWAELAEPIYGCKGYMLDLSYPTGIHDNKIGADATRIPLPDGFASKIALHCAFEMFENDADIRFIPEAYRILKPGGKMVIIPLYIHNLYHAEQNPRLDRRGLDYQGAERYWRPNFVRFARFYSVEAFKQRIVNNMADFHLNIYSIENEKEVNDQCYCKFVAVFEK